MHTPQSLLKEIARLRHMERGKLCTMRSGPSGTYYNHQTWTKGRNVVRYVPPEQVAALQSAIAGYQQFLRLTEAYASLIIQQSRQQRSAATHPPPAKHAPAAKPRKPEN